MADGPDTRSSRAAALLDLRRIIGGVLALYGVVLTVVGLVSSHAQKVKAAGENVNLWTGIALIVAGALFLVWSFTRPLVPDDLDDPSAGGGPDS
jgi:drug/metabolite transporter (DMT)-like permease